MMAELLKDMDVQKKGASSTVKGGEALKGKMVGLYCAAHFDPKCREFTPVLKEFYEEVVGAGEDFEIVFVSLDRSAKGLAEHMADGHGDWYYLPFGSPAIEKITWEFGLGSPGLMIVKSDGSIVSKNVCREMRGKSPKVTFSQWKEAPPLDLFKDDPIVSPEQAVEELKKLTDFTSDQEEALLTAIKKLDLANYLLVVKVNHPWVEEHGQPKANTILDFIATWEKSDGGRRDSSSANAHHFLYTFGGIGELEACREAFQKMVALRRVCYALNPYERENQVEQFADQFGYSPLGPWLGRWFVNALPKHSMAEIHYVSKQGEFEYDYGVYDFFTPR